MPQNTYIYKLRVESITKSVKHFTNTIWPKSPKAYKLI